MATGSIRLANAAPSAHAESDRLLDVGQVVDKLRMSRRAVYRGIDAGLIPPGCRIGKLRRWSERELESWIAAGCRPVRRK